MTKAALWRENWTRRLKKELKNSLRVPPEEPIFAELEDSGAFEEALTSLQEHRNRGEVLEVLRKDYWARRAALARSQTSATKTEKRPGLHLEAMLWRAVALADQREDVQEFRDVILHGGVLEPGEVARFHSVRSHPASIESLREIAGKLSRAFGWSESDAARFVLTADAPEPLEPTFGVRRARVGQPDWITLSYDAHMTEKDLLEMHRAARAHLEHMPLSHADLETRTVTIRTAELAAITDELNDGRTWESLMEAHNDRYPGHQYEDVGNFAQAAKEAFRAMYQADLEWKMTAEKTAHFLAQVVEDAKRKEHVEN